MPRANITVVEITRAGVAPTEVAGDVANGHQFDHGARTFLVARNADAGGAHTVTIITPVTVDSLAVADRQVSVPASATRYIGPFTSDYRQSDGKVYVDVDSAQLNLAVFRLP
jgi:zona occludens toxin (predicted ATPase)